MSDTMTPDPYATLDESATLTLQRLLPGSPETVWNYLVDSDLRSQWLAAGDMPRTAGESFELVWRNDELTDPSGPRPDSHSDEHRLQSRVTEFDPPHRLAFEWGSTGGVSFELAQSGDGVLLTVVHRRVSERGTRVGISAGWHTHLDLLATRLAHASPEPFWTTHTRLKAEYEERLP